MLQHFLASTSASTLATTSRSQPSTSLNSDFSSDSDEDKKAQLPKKKTKPLSPRALEARVRSLSVPEEPANPGLLYVGVATLSASVFTRYRSFPIRFLAPPLFFVGSMNYFLPKTAANLSNYYEELENRYVPSLTGPRKSIIDATSKFWARTEGLVESARETASKGVKTGLQQVEQGTGLRVGEVLEHAKAETAQQLNGGRRSV
ncbi:unnamed protein product [Tilletia controversa]|nr:unnamed protein product [Tilletia controversa]